MLQESVIIVPRYDNDGASLDEVLDQTMMDLVQTFGGCTVVPGVGAWTDKTGKLHREPVNQVIAVYQVSTAHDNALRAIAVRMGEAAKQLAVYVRYASGAVEIIDLTDRIAAIA